MLCNAPERDIEVSEKSIEYAVQRLEEALQLFIGPIRKNDNNGRFYFERDIAFSCVQVEYHTGMQLKRAEM